MIKKPQPKQDPLTKEEHVEDHMLTAGYAGYHHAVNTLSTIHNTIMGQDTGVSIRSKHEGGSPIVFGRHPENGRFFVAPKELTGKNPTINYSPEDVDNNHKDEQTAQRMKSALKHLPKVAPQQGVYSGEMMYSKDAGDVKKDGEKFAFSSKSSAYKAHQTSEDGKKIAKAKIGVAIHTAFKGKTLEDMKPEHNPDFEKHKFNEHPDVHLMSSDTNPSENRMSPAHTKAFKDHLAAAAEHYKSAQPLPRPEVEKHHQPLKQYIDAKIKEGKKPSVEGYKRWSMKSSSEGLQKTTTPAIKAAKVAKHEVAMRVVDKNKDHFKALINTHKELSAAKDILVHHLSKSSNYEHTQGDNKKPASFSVSVNNKPSKLQVRTAESLNESLNITSFLKLRESFLI